MVPERDESAPEQGAADADPGATPEQPAQDAEPPAAQPAAAAKPAAKPAADAEEPEAEPPPPPTSETCGGIAIGQEAFEQAVLAGEFDGTDFMFYLEPAGVLNANLVCSRDYPAENTCAGILMTKASRDAKTVFFDDGINPEKYELHFPKEFGYVKSIQHFQPQTREHEKYPWSKKY